MKKIIFLLLLLLLLLPWGSFALSDTVPQDFTIVDLIRVDRLSACERAYNEYQEHIQDRYAHGNQDAIVRCATYMHLVFAYESGFGSSNMCVNHNNCFWIKSPTYDFSKGEIPYKVGSWRFLIFNNRRDGNLAFARLYYKFHMNKHISEFVNGWSMTDRWTYIQFINDRYWHTYDLYYNILK